MKKSLFLTLIALVLIISFSVELSKASGRSIPDFPYLTMDILDKEHNIEEPSGIAYHPQRETLFVVDDGGMVFEIDLNGDITAQKRLDPLYAPKYDPEGITVNQWTGRLYIAAEKLDGILEVDPNTSEIMGLYEVINTDEEGNELFKRGGNGFEGITFIQGGTPEEDEIYICNQDDPPVVLIVNAPPKAEGRLMEKNLLKVKRRFSMPYKDLSGITYYKPRNTLFILNDKNNFLFETTREGKILNQWNIPGKDQEGIEIVGDFMFLAQDSGMILKIKIDKEKLGWTK